MRYAVAFPVWVMITALSVGCAKEPSASSDRPATTNATTPPLEVDIQRVERLMSVAPNDTWRANGLDKRPGEGHVFACVQISAMNKSSDALSMPVPKLAAGGETFLPTSDATASLPDDWARRRGQLEGGKASADSWCFEVPDQADGLRLVLEDTGWADRKGWKLEVPL